MKVGILTLHSQTNYGAILQCWALQETLKEIGCDVVVLDRWSRALHYVLVGPYRSLFPWKWMISFSRMVLRRYGIRSEIRRFRTRWFIKRNLNLSKFHFFDWRGAPKKLGVDCIVVGSDQIFNYNDEPWVYLLENAPHIKAICYAASFGVTGIPDLFKKRYQDGLSRFYAISCREDEGVNICRSLGVESYHVCDPTLLVCKEKWKSLIREKHSNNPSLPSLVCYLIGDENVAETVSCCGEFASAMSCRVKVFLHAYSAWRWDKALPIQQNVDVCMSAGPDVFLDAVSSARWVLTNSFHGLMFALIFEKNVRILMPYNGNRKGMFARIAEISEYVRGPMVLDTPEAALRSFRLEQEIVFDRHKLKLFKNRSMEFLRQQLSSQDGVK